MATKRTIDVEGDELDDSLRSRLDDPEMQAAPRALLRAALRAREIARQTGTPLIIERDGVIVEVDVTEESES